jgi:Lon protease-like protein
MQILNLFPLHTVLFPGMLLPLHIFEARYMAMIQRSLDQEQTFGVAFIRQGQEAFGPLPVPHLIGTTARILQVERFPDERMNLIAVGEERFRIRAVNSEQPYLTAAVELLPMDLPVTLSVIRGIHELQPWISAYLALLRSLGDESLNLELDLLETPKDPLGLLYAAAWLLQVPLTEKQALLEAETAAHLLYKLKRLYRRELAVVQRIREVGEDAARVAAWLN